MYDRRFFDSKLGKAAAISIAAMLAFNVLALGQQLQVSATPLAQLHQTTELA